MHNISDKAGGTRSSPLYLPLRRVTVSKVFYDAVEEEFPGLKKESGYPSLFWHLIFGSWHDTETKRLLLSAPALAEMEGLSKGKRQAGKFLERFKCDVLPPEARFSWSKWSKKRKKCRQLLEFRLGAFDEAVRLEYAKHWHEHGRVYLDGKPYSDANHKLFRLDDRKRADARPGLCEDAKDIQRYLNGLSPNLFTQTVRENGARALEIAKAIKASNVRTEQMRLLRCIEGQPQPFYGASEDGNTVRLFASQSIQNLKGDVRLALTTGWLEADLSCAQLAICAKLWGVEELQSFFRAGKRFWTYVLDTMGVPPELHGSVKSAIKESVYSICFGMREGGVRAKAQHDLAESGLDTSFAGRFLEIPLVQSILRARTQALGQIERNGGAVTPYGKNCPVTNERKPRDIMAEIAQAWEMNLIAPAFKLASGTSEFAIMLYQFDGFSVHFTRRAESWKERIAKVVNDKAEKEGILTKLEWKNEVQPLMYKEEDTSLSCTLLG